MADDNKGAGAGEGEGKVDLKPGDEGYVAPAGEGDGGEGDGSGEGEGTKETPQERVARLRGQLQRAEKDAGIVPEEKPEKKTSKKEKSDELDYGQKAFLVAKGIEDAEEIALVKQVMADTGKSLEDVLGSKYFQAELKEKRDQRAVEKALPNKGNRTGASAANTVEYWIAKGGLPENTPENTQLRRDIVNARAKKEKTGDMFTSNPVVGNPQ